MPPHSTCMLTQDLSDTNIYNPARTPPASLRMKEWKSLQEG